MRIEADTGNPAECLRWCSKAGRSARCSASPGGRSCFTWRTRHLRSSASTAESARSCYRASLGIISCFREDAVGTAPRQRAKFRRRRPRILAVADDPPPPNLAPPQNYERPAQQERARAQGPPPRRRDGVRRASDKPAGEIGPVDQLRIRLAKSETALLRRHQRIDRQPAAPGAKSRTLSRCRSPSGHGFAQRNRTFMPPLRRRACEAAVHAPRPATTERTS